MTTRRTDVMGECEGRTQGVHIAALWARLRTPPRADQRGRSARASLRNELLGPQRDLERGAEPGPCPEPESTLDRGGPFADVPQPLPRTVPVRLALEARPVVLDAHVALA